MGQRAMHEEQAGYGLSPRLWKSMLDDWAFGLKDRNHVIGMYDDFTEFHATSLEGPYIILEGANASVEQVASTGNTSTTGLGLLAFTLTGAGSGGANEEAGIAYGRGLDAPFKLTGDLCFECRLSWAEITAAKWAWFIGLAQAGACVTDKTFVDSTGVFATDYDFIGFQHLYAEGAAVDAMYAVDGNNVDGADNTDLDSVHTLVAGTFVKLGFRYQHYPRRLTYFVNGVEVASLSAATCDLATFPDDNFMTPTYVIKDVAGDDSVISYLDWWACAQVLA